jgi:hypothetical protein
VLPVLVHGDDPVARAAGHAGERRRMLADVAGQPERLDERCFWARRSITWSEASIAPSCTRIISATSKGRPPGVLPGFVSGSTLGDESLERVLALVVRDDNAEAGRAPEGWWTCSSLGE